MQRTEAWGKAQRGKKDVGRDQKQQIKRNFLEDERPRVWSTYCPQIPSQIFAHLFVSFLRGFLTLLATLTRKATV